MTRSLPATDAVCDSAIRALRSEAPALTRTMCWPAARAASRTRSTRSRLADPKLSM
jgi:hypothetical protein